MKKIAVVIIALLVGVLSVFAVGCGDSGESEQASKFETLMDEAEELRVEADSAWDVLYEKIEALYSNTEKVILSALAGDTSSLTPEQTTGLVASAQALLEEAGQVKAKYEAMVKPEYLEYKGVDSYVEYAEAMIAAITAYEASLISGSSFLAQVEPLLASGDTAGLQALIQQNGEEVTKLQGEQKAAKEALEAALEIKSFEKLGE